MKLKIWAVLAAVLLMLSAGLPACRVRAADAVYIDDLSDHIDDAEEPALNAQAEAVYEATGIAPYLTLADDTGGVDTITYAENRYAELGGPADGVLMIITDSEWYVCRMGRAEELISDADTDTLWNGMGGDTYADAAYSYLSGVLQLLEAAGSGGTGSDGAESAGAADAEPAAAEVQTSGGTEDLAYLLDDTGLLSGSDAGALNAKLEKLSQSHGCAVAAMLTSAADGYTAQEMADMLYDSFGYGSDGILLVVCQDTNDWAVTTRGSCIGAFTDAGLKYLSGKFLPGLRGGSWAEAFGAYADGCDELLTKAEAGKPFGSGDLPKGPLPAVWYVVALALGVGTGFLAAGIEKGKLHTVRAQAAANSYVRGDSLHITRSEDQFLFSRTARTARKTSDNSGSTTHTASSGSRAGGASGKF